MEELNIPQLNLSQEGGCSLLKGISIKRLLNDIFTEGPNIPFVKCITVYLN